MWSKDINLKSFIYNKQSVKVAINNLDNHYYYCQYLAYIKI